MLVKRTHPVVLLLKREGPVEDTYKTFYMFSEELIISFIQAVISPFFL
ncbi:MAG TPA: hypothetical protein VF270_05645 [Ignavibacteriaceae bacterium]